jgi:hypothetical protein
MVAKDSAALARRIGHEEEAYKLLEEAALMMARYSRAEAVRSLATPARA